MIKTGDLVVVSKWPCCGLHVGFIGRVEGLIDPNVLVGKCKSCKSDSPRGMDHVWVSNRAIPLPWLKRIDPLPESEETKEREELRV